MSYGAFSTFISGNAKEEFVCEYRNHIINDAVSELPMVEASLPINVRVLPLLIPQLDFLKNSLVLKSVAIIADSEHHSSNIIECIVKKLSVRPRIFLTSEEACLLAQNLTYMVYLSV